MARDERSSPEVPFDPVLELLKGGDPRELARKAGISEEELLNRREIYLRVRAQRAMEDDVVFRPIGRNEPCPCGSGRKYKKCCLERHRQIISRMDPKEVKRRSQRERERSQRDERVREGYALLAAGDHARAHNFALRWLQRYPQEDRLYDIRATAALYLGLLEEAVEITRERWEAAKEHKAYFLTHGRHSFDEPGSPPGHAYAPQAWMERHWVALKALQYQRAYPEDPDPGIRRWIREIRKADDPKRFPQQREEGLRTRQRALRGPVQALKEAGPRARPYLLPLCVRYGWSALLVPEILEHWADPESIRALVDVSMFSYPFLSESCLKALERLGMRAFPYLEEAFQRDRDFDPIKIGLISVAGQIGTEEALHWIMNLMDHPEPGVVNWAGGILAKAGFVEALPKIREANERIGPEPRLEWAIEELEKRKEQGMGSVSG